MFSGFSNFLKSILHADTLGQTPTKGGRAMDITFDKDDELDAFQQTARSLIVFYYLRQSKEGKVNIESAAKTAVNRLYEAGLLTSKETPDTLKKSLRDYFAQSLECPQYFMAPLLVAKKWGYEKLYFDEKAYKPEAAPGYTLEYLDSDPKELKNPLEKNVVYYRENNAHVAYTVYTPTGKLEIDFITHLPASRLKTDDYPEKHRLGYDILCIAAGNGHIRTRTAIVNDQTIDDIVRLCKVVAEEKAEAQSEKAGPAQGNERKGHTP